MDQTETIETAETEAISAGLTDRLRGGFALVQTRFESVEERARARWIGIPTQARSAFDKLVERVRQTLDLPSRSELQSLVERIEALDAKLEALESAAPPPKSSAKKTPAKNTTGKNTTTRKTGGNKATATKKAKADGGGRRAKIKEAARRQKKRS